MDTINPSALTSDEVIDPSRNSRLISIIFASLKEKSGLWVMAVSGALLIFAFGFGADWAWMQRLVLKIFNKQLKHSQYWELGAIAWSVLFGAYYYLTFPFLPKEKTNRVILALLSMGTMILCGLAAYFLRDETTLLHFYFVLAIGVLFCGIDFVLFWWHTGDSRKVFLETLWVADAPMIAAFLTLLCFELRHSTDMALAEKQLFLAGAISFQLIASNVLFIVCQFGTFRRIWSCTERAPA